MATLFTDEPYEAVVAGLRGIGYHGALLEENYKFPDWFTARKDVREVAAATFYQTPTSYDSACIGVVKVNGLREQALVNEYRALGAPIILEVDNYEVREWEVSRNENGHGLVECYPIDRIRQMVVNRTPHWMPEPMRRAKNIGSFRSSQQLGLFAGLIPELEDRIQETLEPQLHEALSLTRAAYLESTGREPNESRLFKLIFWFLTAKVFHDRRVSGFISLGPEPEALLHAVAKHYEVETPRFLTQEAREVAAASVWAAMDSRNLSVEVLSHMWATMLLDADTKRRLGIHRTSRTIVRYIVERIPFRQLGDDELIVLEPCSGSAVFLIGAMNRLRPNLFGAPPPERHKYFTRHLVGVEKEPFGVEISELALRLADFPHRGGWNIIHQDVFEPGALTDYLRRAGVVLCNPPFGNFDMDERVLYQVKSPKKPVELLNRVLDDIHPLGVIGFVLPRNVVDGRGYKVIRKRLAEQFANIELTILPDRAFEDADSEIGILIATDPIPHDASRVVSRRVNDNAEAWKKFELRHEVSTHYAVDMGVKEAERRLDVPDLPEIWDFLSNYSTLGDIAEIYRGVEWKAHITDPKNRARLVRKEPAPGYMRGVAPRTNFDVFEVPRLHYLSMKPEDQRVNAYKREWDMPKAIMIKAARSRGPWKLAAFPDSEGVTCYQHCVGFWPKSGGYDEWLLAAILNSPVANAFIATREGKTNITIETLNLIPVPYFSDSQRERLRELIKQYQSGVPAFPLSGNALADPARLLMEIDALVLDGYQLPPKLETQLLDYFRGYSKDRPTSHDFRDYLPPNCEVYFSLSEHLSPRFKDATVGELLRRTGLA